MLMFYHIIKSELIIGIGPLYWLHSTDLAMRSLYNSGRYTFDVHTMHGKIEIQSEFFNPRDNKDEQDKMKKWEDEYYENRKKVADMIGEPISEEKLKIN